MSAVFTSLHSNFYLHNAQVGLLRFDSINCMPLRSYIMGKIIAEQSGTVSQFGRRIHADIEERIIGADFGFPPHK